MEQKIGFGTGLVKGGMQEYRTTDPWPNARWEEHEPLPTAGEVAQYLVGAALLAVFCFFVLGLS